MKEIDINEYEIMIVNCPYRNHLVINTYKVKGDSQQTKILFNKLKDVISAQGFEDLSKLFKKEV